MAITGKNPRPIKGKVNDKDTPAGNKAVKSGKGTTSKVSKSTVPSKVNAPKNPKMAQMYTKKASNANLFSQRYGTGILDGDKPQMAKGDGGALDDRGNARLSREISGFGGNKLARKGSPMRSKKEM